MNPSPQTNNDIAYGSVCSGIEAVSLAWEPLGLKPAWFSETDAFASAVLAHRYPHVPNLGDMAHLARRLRAREIPAPDILVGGTPCQSFSVAGARQGLSDPRGALTLAYVEIANAIDQVRTRSRRPPATLVWENVPGVLSDRSNAFGCLLGALAGEDLPLEPPGPRWTNAGCVSGPRRRIAWRVLDAQYFGVAQRRRRVFLVASGGDHIDPAEILFEQEGVRGDPSPGYAPWQGAARAAGAGAPTASRSPGLTSPYGKVSISMGFGNAQGPADVAACLLGAPPRFDLSTETMLVQSVAGAISHTLDTANGGKGSGEDGTGKGVPIIAFTAQGCGADADAERSPTLRAGPHRTSHANAGVVPAIAFAQNSRSEVRWESGHGQIAGALSTGGGKAGQGRPMVLQAAAHEDHYVCALEDGDTAWGLRWRVRRLMPRECERLQGMPDDHTLVPYRGKPAADAPRYRAIGNSMAVPCVAWLGARLRRSLVGKS
ncbi:DNA cytosine methyltransferase [Xanthomonas phaseoli pv. dieffenbachiae]|uniref:DNA cytosine methyltransferase n=1 Tax=Xanthomonas TaxID=338 RepID=UPI0006E66EE5|nr:MULTISPECIES: DNA cytosine methyltransferase [Xanthomonas]MBO9748661.1 DNA cytosine methyltransferase [Xanthomonas phaseoli pv. dieffenbachiae]MBO9753711.1 DNA cytosine methyltransferase [Xanthomonas phaseoli pv. dieffenbachiae]MBO9891827.1 DNA cytosine methyltransferase [Xanthomonas sp. D-36-1]OQP70620.1 DNA methyltransferase [Xanthomonas citri]